MPAVPNAGGTPLLEAALEEGHGHGDNGDYHASAPAFEEIHPSAPPEVLSPSEFRQLLTSLPQGSSDLPTEQALRQFRTATAGKVVWTEQMREIATSAAGGGLLMREAYERQLILDPESLTTTDGPWAECIPSAPPDTGAAQAAQALMNQLMVIRFDGKVANISVVASQTWLDIGHQAASRFGDLVFDASSHVLLGVGQATNRGLKVGQTVKLTAVINRPELNGKIGRITKVNGAEVDVALPRGLERLHQDNVMPHNVSVVSRSESFPLDFTAVADTSTVLRVLWLERSPASQTSPKSRASTTGPLRVIGWQYVGMSARKHNLVSLGEFRNFLWNLHLEDSNFAVVSKRFAPTGNYIDYEEVLFLLGRSHLRCKEVPIDALIYEAVVSILGRRTTAHIDRDLGAEDRGLGKRNACKEHCASYFTSFILEAVIWSTILFILFMFFIDECFLDIALEPMMLIPAALAYVVYIVHLACCVRLTRAFANQTEGIESVMLLMDKPRHENPRYNWHVQCYHYRTERRTRRNKDGKTETYTEQVKVITHSASASGTIPSEDLTSEFLPNTMATQTQIETKLDLDFSSSNYLIEYNRWKNFHRRDVYQDSSHAENLPSRVGSCLAVWSQRNMPCWLNAGCYWLANLFAMSFLYRLLAQSRVGKQEYVYAKRCFNIVRGRL